VLQVQKLANLHQLHQLHQKSLGPNTGTVNNNEINRRRTGDLLNFVQTYLLTSIKYSYSKWAVV
jgi:hypothetical protein